MKFQSQMVDSDEKICLLRVEVENVKWKWISNAIFNASA